MPHLRVEKRQGNFDEVELGFEEGAGRAEAGRCLNCGYCCECYQCVKACLANAVDHSQKPEILEVEVGSVVLRFTQDDEHMQRTVGRTTRADNS